MPLVLPGPVKDILAGMLAISEQGSPPLITKVTAGGALVLDGSGCSHGPGESPIRGYFAGLRDILWRMTDYNWSEINGEVTDRLVKAKTPAVPAAIVALAQKSVDTDPTLRNCKAGHHQFGEDEVERCESFVKFMRKAGYHTKPESTIKVVADPKSEGNILYIEWYARLKPGRKVPDAPAAAPANGAPPVPHAA